MKTRLSTDMENMTECWWDAAHQARDQFPESVRPLLDWRTDCTEVIVPDEDADAFVALAETLPGWDDGPAYARHPVIRYAGE